MPDGEFFHFRVIDEVYIKHSGKSNKLLYLQRLKFDEDGRIEFRLCYYVIGKKPGMRGRWVWGQYAPMLLVPDFRKIVRMAKRKGWLDRRRG